MSTKRVSGRSHKQTGRSCRALREEYEMGRFARSVVVEVAKIAAFGGCAFLIAGGMGCGGGEPGGQTGTGGSSSTGTGGAHTTAGAGGAGGAAGVAGGAGSTSS